MKYALELGGMTCNHCRMAVDEALEQLEGITSKEVSIGKAVIETSSIDDIKKELASVLEEEGYPLLSVSEHIG
ncbi:MAG: heavy-metal-associated domain-containing protein [Bacteroidetes bacterium]|nr:heavy-metal-associated domain-containing protein [Bacteroidota bacterium]MDA1333023.1 heavy-metal-associated domain-containing protein [Bacteroidota bacterium]